jgi:4-hydroxybenzoate polyprenyltransferase
MESLIPVPDRRRVHRDRLTAYARFLKLEHTLFSLPLLFAGALLAGKDWPSARISLLILAAGTGARTLALALNRLIDMRIDRRNPRTADRELASGKLSVGDALLVAAGGLALYLWAAQAINDFCLLWSWVPVLLFLIYPMLKRFTWLCHFGLGVTWAMAPLAGWFAVRPGFAGCGPAVLLGVFCFFWLAGFDIVYATLDEEFDRREGLFSVPARFGRRGALRISAVTHALAFVCLASLYFVYLSGPAAAFLVMVSGLLLFSEHVLVNNIDLAFFKVNAVAGFVILTLIFVGVKTEF